MTENIAGHRNVLVEKDVSISHLYVGPFGGRHVIDCMAKLGPDALVISTDGYLPNLSGEELDKVGFPIFIPTEAVWGDGRPTFLAKIEAAEEYGVVGLNVYPDQKSLWEFDHKYFLFEGHCKWVF